MLEYLKLTNVGPAPTLELNLNKRFNILTGDNGLGKSFLLDVAWWALTRKWPHDLNPKLTSGYPARPTDPKTLATIQLRLTSKVKSVTYESEYKPREEAWVGKSGRPWNPGLVIYAHADGGFSVWDPARNYWKKRGNVDVQDRLGGYVFAADDVWRGLVANIDGHPTLVCKGLLDDWSVWIRENGENARRMSTILNTLAPLGESTGIGPLVRLSVNDPQDIPTIRTPYDQTVPIVHASSGVRRVAGLAYMLMWSWSEHSLAADQLGEERTRQVIFLFDEVESHLHPRWQRSILKALRDAAALLHEQAQVQLIVSTHSPLVLASAESWFDPDTDAWFDFDLENDPPRVHLRQRAYTLHGTAGSWLTSEAFDLPTDRGSIEAENAILEARKILRFPHPPLPDVLAVHQRLRAVLPDVDRFWVRWNSFVERCGGLP